MNKLELKVPKKYEDIVHAAIKHSLVLTIPGSFIPYMDEVGMAGIWGKMIYDIAERANKPMTMEKAAKLTAAIIAGIMMHKTAHMLIVKVLAWTGLGMIIAVPLNVIVHGLFTYRLGKFLAYDFENNHVTGDDLVRYATVIVPFLIPLPGIDELYELTHSF